MIGNKRTHIQHHEDRAYCDVCQSIESMKHTLLDCDTAMRHLIWAKARALWPHGPKSWPDISISTILGIGSIQTPDRLSTNDDNTGAPTLKSRGQTRLLQIVIAEAGHLIWVIRCKRVIQNRQHRATRTKMEQGNYKPLYITDKIVATKIKREDPDFMQLVEATWGTRITSLPSVHPTHREEVFSG